MQVNELLPVFGRVVSLMTGVVALLFTGEANVPLQVFPPTVQVTSPEHWSAQVAPALAVSVPLVQVKVAVPRDGPVESLIDGEVAPLLSAAGVEPLQVFPPTLQDTVDAGHWLPQVAPAFCVATPLLQAKVELPVVGAVVSVTAGELAPLLTVPDSVPLQVLPPTVQVTAPEQPALQVAPAF